MITKDILSSFQFEDLFYHKKEKINSSIIKKEMEKQINSYISEIILEVINDKKKMEIYFQMIIHTKKVSSGL